MTNVMPQKASLGTLSLGCRSRRGRPLDSGHPLARAVAGWLTGTSGEARAHIGIARRSGRLGLDSSHIAAWAGNFRHPFEHFRNSPLATPAVMLGTSLPLAGRPLL